VEHPTWKKLFVESNIPEKLAPLKELSRNLWWAWNIEARALFQSIDPVIWDQCEHNPIVLLDDVNYQRLQELENDQEFILKMNHAYELLQKYLADREAKKDHPSLILAWNMGYTTALKYFQEDLVF